MARTGGIGGSLFLIALGAILAWAVSVDVEGFSINTIGLILLGVGAVGLVISLIAAFAAGRRHEEEPDVIHVDN